MTVSPDDILPDLENVKKRLEAVKRQRLVFVGDLSVTYGAFACVNMLLGIFLMLAPRDWYGPTWSYFPFLPHGGFWMGACCLGLGLLQLVALWRLGVRYRVLGTLLFMSGFVYWTSAMMLGLEGLVGHGGLMEVPFMFYVGGHKFAHSAALFSQHYNQRLVAARKRGEDLPSKKWWRFEWT